MRLPPESARRTGIYERPPRGAPRTIRDGSMKPTAHGQKVNMTIQETLRKQLNVWILKHPETLTLEQWGNSPSIWRKTVLVGLLLEWLGECLMPTLEDSDRSADPTAPGVLTRALGRFIDRYPGPFTMGLSNDVDALKSRARTLALLLDRLVRSYPELLTLSQSVWGHQPVAPSRGSSQARETAFLAYLQARPELLEVGEQDEEKIRELMRSGN